MADEQIAFWQRHNPKSAARIHAYEVWSQFSLSPYPGGGWERVRAEMVRWLLDEYAPSLPLAA